MNKNILIRLSELADELDSNNLYKEANVVTETMTRIAQGGAYSVTPSSQRGTGIDINPATRQKAPPGYEYTLGVVGVPDGTLKPKGWSDWFLDQKKGEQIIRTIGTPAFDRDPKSGSQAPQGQEWSPAGYLQPKGQGAKFVRDQLKNRTPLYGTDEPTAPGTPQTQGQARNQQGGGQQGGDRIAQGSNEYEYWINQYKGLFYQAYQSQPPDPDLLQRATNVYNSVVNSIFSGFSKEQKQAFAQQAERIRIDIINKFEDINNQGLSKTQSGKKVNFSLLDLLVKHKITDIYGKLNTDIGTRQQLRERFQQIKLIPGSPFAQQITNTFNILSQNLPEK